MSLGPDCLHCWGVAIGGVGFFPFPDWVGHLSGQCWPLLWTVVPPSPLQCTECCSRHPPSQEEVRLCQDSVSLKLKLRGQTFKTAPRLSV